MFSVDFMALQKYLNPNKKKLESKGIDSVISRVINLKQICPELDHEKFVPHLIDSFIEYHGRNEVTEEQISLDKLEGEKNVISLNYERLKSWDWIYGECPYFKYSIEKKFGWGLIELTFEVKNSVIS